MESIFINNLNLALNSNLIFGLIILLCVSLLVLNYLKKNSEHIYLKIREDIKFAIEPKFLDVSLGANDLVDLAIEIWRIEQRLLKVNLNLQENQVASLDSSIQKMKRYLEKYDVQIMDYKNQKYNEGFNIDVLSVEKDEKVLVPTIRETIEPSITVKGQLVRKAKVILIKNN